MRVTRPRHGVSASAAAPTALSTIRTRSRDAQLLAALATEQKSVEAVQRLTQENWRLFRKYERMEYEIQEMRFSQQAENALHEADPAPDPTEAKRPDTYKRSPTGLVERIDRSDKGGKEPVNTSFRQEKSVYGEERNGKFAVSPAHRTRAFPNIRSGSTSPKRKTAGKKTDPEDWELQMENALAHLRAENKKLFERVRD